MVFICFNGLGSLGRLGHRSTPVWPGNDTQTSLVRSWSELRRVHASGRSADEMHGGPESIRLQDQPLRAGKAQQFRKNSPPLRLVKGDMKPTQHAFRLDDLFNPHADLPDGPSHSQDPSLLGTSKKKRPCSGCLGKLLQIETWSAKCISSGQNASQSTWQSSKSQGHM